MGLFRHCVALRLLLFLDTLRTLSALSGASYQAPLLLGSFTCLLMILLQLSKSCNYGAVLLNHFKGLRFVFVGVLCQIYQLAKIKDSVLRIRHLREYVVLLLLHHHIWRTRHNVYLTQVILLYIRAAAMQT